MPPFLRLLLTVNFCPRVDERIRWLRHPFTVLAAAALLALLIGVLIHGNGYVLFACLASILAIGVLWPWQAARLLRGELQVTPARLREGDVGTAVLRLRNRSWFAAWGLTIEGAPGEPPAVRCLDGRCEREFRWTFRARRRGELPDRPIRVATSFPFGLLTCSTLCTISQTALVWPRTFRVGSVPEANADAWREGNFVSRRDGGGGDVVAVRPYRRGDSLRRIHWAQTARHDRLIVCEQQSTTLRRIRIVLASIQSDRADGESIREWAIRIVASLAEGWIAEGVLVEVVGSGLNVPMGTGSEHRRCILDALARLPIDRQASVREDAADTPTAETTVVVGTVRERTKARPALHQDRKWIVLDPNGFGENDLESITQRHPLSGACDEGSIRRPQSAAAWLLIRRPEDVARSLEKLGREASHAC
ncbi:MAG: DUF58 domain-containing protein [Gemmataceae bacterium]